MRNPRTLRPALLGAALLLASGCFSYVPVETAAVAPGQEVQVHLTRQGLAELEQLDMAGGATVRGRVVEREGDGVLLRVPITRVQEGFHSVALGQDIPIPSRAIVQIERRELNRGGTALLVGGTAALAAAVIYFIVGEGFGDDTQEPPEPPEIRIPLSVPVP